MKGNGGIASWTKKFLATFPRSEYNLYPVNIAPDKDFTKFRGRDRLYYGIKSFLRVRKEIKKLLRNNSSIPLMHITSGGGLGIIRDYYLAKALSKRKLKTILHCRFGNIAEMTTQKGFIGRYTQRALDLYDQIWVLDKKSYNFLRENQQWKDKIFLTPNSIEVPATCDLKPKDYKRVGFVGNIVPTKGIFELVEAVQSIDNDTELFVVGQGLDEDIKHIKDIAGEKFDKTIHLLGRLPNTEAVKMMESFDIICLPTYYQGEAFPISILEAMSKGKLVISCSRAAIPDMLTAVDGSNCGVLVPEKNVKAIADAIKWSQGHKSEADDMCKKAYEKVKTAYCKEVVYEIYKGNYRKLLHIDGDSKG